MITASYNAADLFTVRTATPLAGNPAWANLKIDSNKRLHRNVVCGAGLYAIHYRGHLLYIGKFLGTRTNPFAGNVCFTRWAKHLGTLTLRDRRVSFSRKAIDDMRLHQPLAPPLADIVAAVEHPVITKPRGRVSSLNRALFAAENWGALSQLGDAQGLADFTITYSRMEAGIARHEIEVRSAISAAEKSVISISRPRCNAEIVNGTGRALSLKEIGHVLEQALVESFGAMENTPDALAPAELMAGQVEEDEAEIPDDAADTTAEEAFLERLNDDEDALFAVASIEEAFDAIGDAYVEYTKANGGDLRIRSTAGPRAFRNVVALEWQRKLHRFCVEINLTVERCLELGASTALPNYVGKPLATRATFSMPHGTAGMLRCLIEAAVQQRRNRC